ncbi:MgtC/SapB family protein [Mannheimia cairinae]
MPEWNMIADTLNQQINFDTILKISLACLFGGIIGLEREKKRKPVGVKTCLIITVVTCLLTIVSINAAEYYASMSENIRTDPMRLAAQVISGIGFIGTGAIMHKTRDAVSGITTAAMIWASAGIGITLGVGFYADAFFATIVIMLVLKYSSRLRIHKQEALHRVTIRLEVKDMEYLPLVTQCIEDELLSEINAINIKEQERELLELTINANIPDNLQAYKIYQTIRQIDGIYKVEIKHIID